MEWPIIDRACGCAEHRAGVLGESRAVCSSNRARTKAPCQLRLVCAPQPEGGGGSWWWLRAGCLPSRQPHRARRCHPRVRVLWPMYGAYGAARADPPAPGRWQKPTQPSWRSLPLATRTPGAALKKKGLGSMHATIETCSGTLVPVLALQVAPVAICNFTVPMWDLGVSLCGPCTVLLANDLPSTANSHGGSGCT